ncbi:hypothetical protein ACFC6U_33735 [Kitasatospora purpeofusca]|uniref:hypothetical protein n=1 Tax=Kitasatospora purpeofusca TaxID=67352 RepID=UPI0035E15354
MARFEDVQQSLWDTGSDYGVQSPVADLLVLEVKRLLDVTLPGSCSTCCAGGTGAG